MHVVLLNRRARRFARDASLVDRVRSSARGMTVFVTNSVEELEERATQAHSLGARSVILCGGDGTYTFGLTALARAWGSEPMPEVALLPGGTVGTIARNMGVSGDPAAHLGRLSKALADGSVKRRELRTLRANDRVGCIFGAALVGSFFERYYEGGAKGTAGAAVMVARIFLGSFLGTPYARSVLDPIEATVLASGREVPFDRFSLLCCATVLDLGLHMHVCYRCHEREDRLHLVASGLPTMRLGPQMTRVLRGQRLRGTPHFDELVDGFEVRFRGERPWVLDGELLHAEVVRVAPGPTVRVLSA